MIRVLNALKSVLELEAAEYKKMLVLAAEKRDVLFKNDVKGLELIVAKELSVLKAIKHLEAQREELIGKAAVLSHRAKDTMRLTDIIEILNGDLKEEFIRIRGELSGLVAELKKSCKANKGLIETQLQYASFCVNLLSGQAGPLSLYSHEGEINNKEEITYLVDRSV